jgi:hypothetical protein
MALQGMIQLEDLTVFFGPTGEPDAQMFFVRVNQFGPKEQFAEAVVHGPDLMATLALAISWDGEGTNEGSWNAAERVTTALGGIRICP